MSCLSLGFWENILVWIVIFAAAWMLIELVLGWLASNFNPMGLVSLVQQALKIIFLAAVAIFVIYLIFALISCLLGGSVHLPSIR